MRSALLIISLVLGYAASDSAVLRPCFERYANHRLVNVRPYHSEWRMKSEDNCLLFCAQSASRCRSVVYDTVQHICHYFTDEGVDQAVIAAKMTYLRVISKECLEENADNAADPNSLTPPDSPPILLTNNNRIDEHELTIEQPPVEESPISTTTQEVITFEPVTEETTTESETTMSPEIVEEELDKQLAQFQGSFESSESQTDNNGIYRDKLANQAQWIDSAEKMHTVEKKKTVTDQLEEMKEENPAKYEKLMGEEKKEEEEETPKTRYGAKIIKFDEDAAFRKQSELRRAPELTKKSTARPNLKVVTISSTSYIQKAKSFLDELNDDDDEQDSDITTPSTSRSNPITTECSENDVSVWVAFENSEQDDEKKSSADANVQSKKDCQRLCEEQKCRSFTYFEKSRTCHLSQSSNGVTLKAPAAGDFTASSSTKFCYPSTFSVFEGCSNFVAFRDYSVKLAAAEEFDGLPKGYDGMQLCVELCVLSTRYTCRSATFNPITGQCRLLSEDSLSSPDNFEYDEFQKYLYFENGCTSTSSSDEIQGRQVEVVTTKPKKLKKKVKKVRRVRRIRRH